VSLAARIGPPGEATGPFLPATVGRMGRAREALKRMLPGRLFNWFRRKRINVLEAAGGQTQVTPGVLMKAVKTKTHPVRTFARATAARVLPERFVNRYRRRRVTRAYLEALSWELLERETRLDYLEGRVAARRDGFYERMVGDVLERTEIILQELDRRIEGVATRSGQELAAVEEQLAGVRRQIAALHDEVAKMAPRDALAE